MKVALVGDIVKFIGTDGKWAFTELIDFQTENHTTMAVLELQGEDKGKTGMVEWKKIKWNGKQFIIDLREDDNE